MNPLSFEESLELSPLILAGNTPKSYFYESDSYFYDSKNVLKTTSSNTTDNKILSSENKDISDGNTIDDPHTLESNADNKVISLFDDNFKKMEVEVNWYDTHGPQLPDLGTPKLYNYMDLDRNLKNIYYDNYFVQKNIFQNSHNIQEIIHPMSLCSTEEILQKLSQNCSVFLKEVKSIGKYYRESKRQKYFRWFSRYSIQKKIKTNFLKFNLKKISNLINDKCIKLFPKFNKKIFVDTVDLEFEGKLFDYPSMYEIMKVDKFIKEGNIDDFLNKNCFKSDDCYNEFEIIIYQKYSEWIQQFLIHCLNKPTEAEKIIKMNKKTKHENSNYDINMSRYMKLFWFEVSNYTEYFFSKSPNKRPEKRMKNSKN